MLSFRFYAPDYSKLALELEHEQNIKNETINKAEERYKKAFKDIRKKCSENNHYYDDGVSALIGIRYSCNDYRYECQICGIEIKETEIIFL